MAASLWFPRAELLLVLAVLPALAWGEAGAAGGRAGGRARPCSSSTNL